MEKRRIELPTSLLAKYADCAVCSSYIEDRKGGLFADNLVKELRTLEHQYGSEKSLLKSDFKQFANAITLQYYMQFQDIFGDLRSRSAKQTAEDVQNNKERLKQVLAKAPEHRFLFLFAHDSCLPQRPWAYDIGIEELNTPEKVSRWEKQLRSKKWFNPEGWKVVMWGLYGRFKQSQEQD